MENYQMVRHIGRGSSGTVSLVQHTPSTNQYILKQIHLLNPDQSINQSIIDEVRLLRLIDCAFVVRYIDCWIDRSNQTLNIVMQHCEGGDLHTAINKQTTIKQAIEQANKQSIKQSIKQTDKQLVDVSSSKLIELNDQQSKRSSLATHQSSNESNQMKFPIIPRLPINQILQPDPLSTRNIQSINQASITSTNPSSDRSSYRSAYSSNNQSKESSPRQALGESPRRLTNHLITPASIQLIIQSNNQSTSSSRDPSPRRMTNQHLKSPHHSRHTSNNQSINQPTESINPSDPYFSECQILDWLISLCIALKYCHDRRILHRDLKAQNIFLTKAGDVRLGDFGVSKVIFGTAELANTVVGTPFCMSPEVLSGQPYGYAADVWSLGCVMYNICALRLPFEANNLLGLVNKIAHSTPDQLPDVYSTDLKHLIFSMLDKAPDQRPSIKQILQMTIVKERVHIRTEMLKQRANKMV